MTESKILKFTTKDGIEIEIAQGGEQINRNTYGFEIEFCSHACPIFTYTHIYVADIILDLGETNDIVTWTIETDSDNVFELVTGAIMFPSVTAAYAAKEKLTRYLVASVSTETTLTFGQWKSSLQQESFKEIITNIFQKKLNSITTKNCTLAKVFAQSNENNIDTKTDIEGAILYRKNYEEDWDSRIDEILIWRSQKDAEIGYSSQVNMPMTLPGYFLYQIAWKLQNLNKNFEDTPKISWLWLNTITQIYRCYISLLTGTFQYKDIGIIDVNNIQTSIEMTISQLRKSSFVFLVANKVVSGALGKISEKNQLQMQQIADISESTEIFFKPAKYSAEINSSDIEKFKNWFLWLPFHSHLKDLTALWFKGALKDVISKERFDKTFYMRLGQTLCSPVMIELWQEELQKYQSEYVKAVGDYPEVMADFNIGTLCNAIMTVQFKLGNFLQDEVSLSETFAFNLPPRANRPFLGYDEKERAWEGRYDTMWSALGPFISADSTVSEWRYLIEHRRH